jgi:hypothetical protein
MTGWVGDAEPESDRGKLAPGAGGKLRLDRKYAGY